MIRVLIAEDNDDLRNAIERALKRRGFATIPAANGHEALAEIRRGTFDLALVDIKMPGPNGIEVLKTIRKTSPRTRVILMTAFSSVDTAIEALRQEAADYLLKPFSLEELESSIDRILEHCNLSLKRVVEEGGTEEGGPNDERLLGHDPQIERMRQLLSKVSPTSSPVLLLGETGTGKEVLAQEIHRLSNRSDKPFVAVNCVALAEGVLESELFGHEKGAFTSAISQKLGLLEVAKGGTVFLDEIGEISQAIQVKLLRFLQEHEIQRVGGTKTIKVDARVIAATNRDLKEEVKAKRFREDLFYRLNVFEIILPPLRERMGDLPLLLDHFLKKYQSLLQKEVSLAPEAKAALKSYRWPGNIRELENVIERAVVLADRGEIGLDDMPIRLLGGQEGAPPETTATPQDHDIRDRLESMEKEILRKALQENCWNQSKAARQLGIKRSTLQYRMQKYALSKAP